MNYLISISWMFIQVRLKGAGVCVEEDVGWWGKGGAGGVRGGGVEGSDGQ